MALQNSEIDARRSRTLGFTLHGVVNRGGENREMRLVQTAQHLAHCGARFVPVLGCRYPRPELLMDRLPVETAGVFLPMCVADGGPDFFEGVEIPLAFRGEELRVKA